MGESSLPGAARGVGEGAGAVAAGQSVAAVGPSGR